MRLVTFIILLFLVGCAELPYDQPGSLKVPELTDEHRQLLVRHQQFMEVEQVFERCVLIQVVVTTIDGKVVDKGQVRNDCYILTAKQFPWILEATETEEKFLQEMFDQVLNSIKT